MTMNYSSTPARRYLMGKERTTNPSPAAASILERAYGKRRTQRAISSVLRTRRSAHRGNPLPAIVALAASKLPGLTGLFKKGSGERAAGPAGQLVDAAVNGNLTAAKAIIERTTIGIQKERSVWLKASQQIPPSVLALVKKYAAQIPGVDHSSPEAAAETALSRAIDGNELEAAEREKQEQATAARTEAARARSAAGERREARLTELGAAGLQAIARGGRRPARRRRRRTYSY